MIYPYKYLSLFHWHPRKDNILNLIDFVVDRDKNSDLRVIDVGCGPGFFAKTFFLRGQKYVGIDPDQKSIRYAITNNGYPTDSIEFICEDATNLSIEFSQNDIVILNGVVHHLSDEEFMKVISNISKSYLLIICDHIKVTKSFFRYHSYLLQKWDKGNYIRELKVFEEIKGFTKLQSIHFTINLIGLPAWPYFANIYINDKLTDN